MWAIIGLVVVVFVALSMFLDYRSGLGDRNWGGNYDRSLDCVYTIEPRSC